MSLIRFLTSGAVLYLTALACSSPASSDPGTPDPTPSGGDNSTETGGTNSTGNTGNTGSTGAVGPQQAFSTPASKELIDAIQPVCDALCKKELAACPGDKTTQNDCVKACSAGSNECLTIRGELDAPCQLDDRYQPTCNTNAKGLQAVWDMSVCPSSGTLSSYACQTKPTSGLPTPVQALDVYRTCLDYCLAVVPGQDGPQMCPADLMTRDECNLRCYTGSAKCLLPKQAAYKCQMDSGKGWTCAMSNVDQSMHMDWTIPDCADQESAMKAHCTEQDLLPIY